MAPKQIWTIADTSTPAISLPDLQAHCRVTSTEETALLQRMALAATLQVEKQAQRVLVRRQAVLRLACLPSGRIPLVLPGGPATVTAMTISGVAFAAYEVIGSSPARMVPTDTWPSVVLGGYPVSITYTVGPLTPPEDLAAAAFLMAAEMFERRSDGTEASVLEVPISSQYLIKAQRIWPT